MAAVENCGVNVQPWRVRRDGSPVSNPEVNPQHCYEWAFGGKDEPIALCVWHLHLKVRSGNIVYEDNVRELALALDRQAEQAFAPADVISRSRSQAKRARKFDALLQLATRHPRPIRLIVLEGDLRNEREPGLDASSVRFRRVDTEPWRLEGYDWGSGAFVLTRGVDAGPEVAVQVEALEDPLRYVDQFSAPTPPATRGIEAMVYARSPAVRSAVLLRADGLCESCGQPGFATPTGETYLETHHVVALSAGGPDVIWNVVALCPNDHRRAHYSGVRDAIQQALIQKLVSLYPETSVHWGHLLQLAQASGEHQIWSS
jgi:hypothetical protein